MGPPPTRGCAPGHGGGCVPGAAWPSSAEIRGIGRTEARSGIAWGIAAGPGTGRVPGTVVGGKGAGLWWLLQSGVRMRMDAGKVELSSSDPEW